MNANSIREISILLDRIRDILVNINRIIRFGHKDEDLIFLRSEVADCEQATSIMIDQVTLEILTRENKRADKRKRSVD